MSPSASRPVGVNCGAGAPVMRRRLRCMFFFRSSGTVSQKNLSSTKTRGGGPGAEKDLGAEEGGGGRPRVVRVEAQLADVADELWAHLEMAAVPAHRAVLAHLALRAMEEDLREILAPRHRSQLLGLIEEVVARGAGRRRVLARVIFRAEPRPMLRLQICKRDRRLGELVADLFPPRPVPFLDAPFPFP